MVINLMLNYVLKVIMFLCRFHPMDDFLLLLSAEEATESYLSLAIPKKQSHPNSTKRIREF